jgi:NNP family nitrate/nitrite transporter-like MFS transporter
MLNDLTGLWTSCFMLLFVLVVVSAAWMHLAIRRMERKANDADQLAFAAQ